MAILDSWAIGNTADRKVGTEDARRAVGALMWGGSTAVGVQEGLRRTLGTPGKVDATGTPGPNVTVQAFQAFLDDAGRPGPYIGTMDAALTVPILDVPADPSNQRNDLIVAQQNDADYGDANRSLQVVRVQGTPAGSPVDPTVTGSPNYLTLARVRVTAGATTITNAMIDDLRPQWVAALGGIKPCRDLTERATLPALEALAIYRLDKDWVEIHDGSAWRVQGLVQCAALADITDPVTDQLAHLTTDNMIYRWTGSAWVGAVATGGTGTGDRHRFKYRQTGTPQSIANNTQQRLSFNTTDYSTTDWTTSTVSSGTVFTCAREGSWQIIVNTRLNGAGAGERAVTAALEGDPNTIYAIEGCGTQGTFPYSASMSFEKDFNVGNAFTVYEYQASGGAVTMAFAEITIRYMGPKAT